MCANFEDPRSRNCEWRQKKHEKNNDFWFEKLLPVITYNSKPLDVQSWNLDTMWMHPNALCKLSWGAPGHVTKILQAENGKTLISLNRYI